MIHYWLSENSDDDQYCDILARSLKKSDIFVKRKSLCESFADCIAFATNQTEIPSVLVATRLEDVRRKYDDDYRVL